MSTPAKARKQRDNGYNLARWRGRNGLRARALRRDLGLCTFRLPGCGVKATSVHLDPALEGDHRRATLRDLRSACHSCHGKVDGPRSPRGGGLTGAAERSPSEGAGFPPRVRLAPKTPTRKVGSRAW